MSLMDRLLNLLMEATCASTDSQSEYENWFAEMRYVYPALDEYVLVHKSRIKVQQEFDVSKAAYLTRAYVMVQKTDLAPEIEVLYATQGREVCLVNHKDWAVAELIRFLEQPDPEQTQPDQP
jgi:hypothetical protein